MSLQIKVYNLPQSGWDLIDGGLLLLARNLGMTNDAADNQQHLIGVAGCDATTTENRSTTLHHDIDTYPLLDTTPNTTTSAAEQQNTYEITITVQLPALSSVRGLFSNLLSTFGVSSQRSTDNKNDSTTLSENANNNTLISESPLVEKPIVDHLQSILLETHQDIAEMAPKVVEKQPQQHAVLIPNLISPQPLEPAFLSECREFIEAGLFELCEEGVGGTYFVKNLSGSIVAVFKPNDEEPGAPANPKDLVQQPLLPPGGGYLREMAAYLLDADRFAGVPETFILTNVSHDNFATSGAKTGSLQRYVKNNGSSTDMGSNAFDIESVHRIGLLDLRIFNLDRNGENLLVHTTNIPSGIPGGKPGKGLVPIDHTFSLPPITSLDSAYFEWHFWSQAKKPFSPESLDYIRQIDIEHDAKVLRALGIPESSIMTMIAMTLLLKEVAGDSNEVDKTYWTLFDIANFVSRLPPSQPSKMEVLVESCRTEVMGEGKVVDATLFLVVLREKLRDIFSQSPQGKPS